MLDVFGELGLGLGDPGAVAGGDQLDLLLLQERSESMKAASELPPGGTIVEPRPRTRSPLKQTPVSVEEADVVLGVAGGGEGAEAEVLFAARRQDHLGLELVGARRCGRRGSG